MNAMKRMAVGFVFAVACANSFAAQGRWTEGFGQGNLEYFIDQDGFRLYIGCPTRMEAQIHNRAYLSLN